MDGLTQFLNIFGNINVTQIVAIIIVIGFCYNVYKKIEKFIQSKYKEDEEKEKKINEALEEVRKYPQYREKSKQIQQELQDKISELSNAQELLAAIQQEMCSSLKDLQEDLRNREKNKLQDRLLQSYRYYTNIERNPKQIWSKMDSQTFWTLFKDYEELGGNGFMHSYVQPAMNLLTVVDNEQGEL